MAKILPKFNFAPATPSLGDGQAHTEARERLNSMRPEVFNEFERIMVEICDIIGDYTFGDTITGAPSNIGGALRYGYSVNKTDIDTLYDTKLDKVGGIITGTTDSTSKDTGALVLEGGLGIEKSLYVGNAAHILQDLTVYGTTDASTKAEVDAIMWNDNDI